MFLRDINDRKFFFGKREAQPRDFLWKMHKKAPMQNNY